MAFFWLLKSGRFAYVVCELVNCVGTVRSQYFSVIKSESFMVCKDCLKREYEIRRCGALC